MDYENLSLEAVMGLMLHDDRLARKATTKDDRDKHEILVGGYITEIRHRFDKLQAALEAQPAQGVLDVKFVWIGGKLGHVDSIVDIVPYDDGSVMVTREDHSQSGGYNSKVLEGDDARRFLEAIAPVTVGMEVGDVR